MGISVVLLLVLLNSSLFSFKETSFFAEYNITQEEDLFNVSSYSIQNSSIITNVPAEIDDIIPPVSFENQKLIRLYNVNDTTLNELLNIPKMDVWSSNLIKKTIVIRTDSSIYDFLLSKNYGASNNMTVINDDLSKLIEQEKARLEKRRKYPLKSAIDYSWFKEYHDYEEIRNWFIRLANDNRFYEYLTYYPSIGKTHRGKDIFIVKITGENRPNTSKKSVWIQSTQHAREWIAAASTTYFIYDLLIRYVRGEERIVQLLETVEIYCVPVCNPDGYQYSWDVDRTWRKNRRKVGKHSYGVDLNRNWDVLWGTEGVSWNPHSEIYPGTRPFSEDETFALRRAFLKVPKKIVATDIHSFSQLLLFPYGHTKGKYRFAEAHKEVGKRMARAIYEVDKKIYTCMESTALYPTSGTATDYFCGPDEYGIYGTVPYSFVYELRPDSWEDHIGFIVPPNEIIIVGKEISASMIELIEFAKTHPLLYPS